MNSKEIIINFLKIIQEFKAANDIKENTVLYFNEFKNNDKTININIMGVDFKINAKIDSNSKIQKFSIKK